MTSNYQHEILAALLASISNPSPLYGNPLKTVQNGLVSGHQRQIINEWVFDLCKELKYSQKIAQLTSTYIDMVLSKKQLNRLNELKIVAALCFSLAMRIEENRYVKINQLAAFCNEQLSPEMVFRSELEILRILQYRLFQTTAFECIRSLFQITHPNLNLEDLMYQSDNYTAFCYSDYELAKFGPLIIGVSSVCCVLEKFKHESFEMDWLMQLNQLVGLDLSQVFNCTTLIKETLNVYDDNSTRDSDSEQ